MKKKLKKLYEIYLVFVFAVFGVAIFYLFYLLFFPFNIIEFKEFRITDVVNGEKVCYILTLKKNYEFKATAKFSVVDTFVYSLKNEPVYRIPGTKTTNRCLALPKEPLKKGVYHLQLDLQYLIAGVRQVNYSFNSDEFTIQ